MKKFAMVLILALLAIRCSYTETISQSTLAMFEPVKSLSISIGFLTIITVGIIIGLRKKDLKLVSLASVGLFVILFVAFAASYFSASDKRAAINSVITILVPIALAIFASQLFTSKKLVQITLIVIVALGIFNAYQCGEQMISSNAMMIEQYEENPDVQLSRLGIEKDTLNHFMYEHRLYSKDIKGSFTTGNSAGTFFLMAIASCVYLLVGQLRINKRNVSAVSILSICLLILLAGLTMTHSKGAIGALCVTTIAGLVYFATRKYLIKFRKEVVIVIVFAVAAVSYLAFEYVKVCDINSFGNSMMVRLGYWKSSIDMAKENPMGVGGGNFGINYTQFKDPAAIETVSDPHNFVLSLACQYGLHTTLFLLLAIAFAMFKGFFIPAKENIEQDNDRGKLGWLAIGVGLLFFLARPLFLTVDFTNNIDVNLYLAIIFFILPAIAFILPAIVLGNKTELGDNSNNTFILALGLVAVLVHNLIDFAIFEPGNWTVMWLMIAIIVTATTTPKTIKLPCSIKRLLTIFTIAIFAVVIFKFYMPVVKSSASIKKTIDTYNPAVLDDAIEADKLSDFACNLKALMLENIKPKNEKQIKNKITKASARNVANYKYYQKLAVLYADSNPQLALEFAHKAIGKYPGSGQLQYLAGQLAEKVNDENLALEHYRKAIEIEKGFQAQFKQMYPDRNVISRLGWQEFEAAKKFINDTQAN